MNKRGGDFEYGMGMGATGPKRSRGGFSSKIGMRVMVPSKMAGSLIGKGGQNIQRLRQEFNCNIRIPDCPGPERIMEITAETWESVFDCLASAVPWLYECPEGIDDGNVKELRFLVNQAVVGGIIGKGGEKIKDIRAKSGCQVKVYQNPCPQSTDRCVLATGTLDKLLLCAREIYDVVQNSETSGQEELYEPVNFDSFFAAEYGGFGGGADPRKLVPFRGGGMGRGRGGGVRGAPDAMRGFPMGYEDPEMTAVGLGAYGPPRAGFGRGGYDAGFSDNEWGGGFGGGVGPKLPVGGTGTGPTLTFETGEDGVSSQVTVANTVAGAIIGPGGQRIRKIRNDSGATVAIGEPDAVSRERIITVSGDTEAIQSATYLLQECVNLNT